jgi:hypothetical protein
MEGSVRTRFHQRKQDHPHRAPLSWHIQAD